MGICIRFALESAQSIDGELVESIRKKIEERGWEWQKGLIGQPNRTHDTSTPVQIFGIAVTPQVEVDDLPGVPLYENDNAECPNPCFRFTYKYEENPQYTDCEHPNMSHIDFDIWYSDFEAAGHGGDWTGIFF